MNKKGFTLIELLVVIAIIGLLSTLAVVALGSARQKSRDAKRLSDMKEVQTALELYYTDNNNYPTSATAITLGSTSDACLNATGWHATGATACPNPYMGQVPHDPTNSGSEIYKYISANGSTYTVSTTLEGSMGGLTKGSVYATPSGISN